MTSLEGSGRPTARLSYEAAATLAAKMLEFDAAIDKDVARLHDAIATITQVSECINTRYRAREQLAHELGMFAADDFYVRSDGTMAASPPMNEENARRRRFSRKHPLPFSQHWDRPTTDAKANIFETAAAARQHIPGAFKRNDDD